MTSTYGKLRFKQTFDEVCLRPWRFRFIRRRGHRMGLFRHDFFFLPFRGRTRRRDHRHAHWHGVDGMRGLHLSLHGQSISRFRRHSFLCFPCIRPRPSLLGFVVFDSDSFGDHLGEPDFFALIRSLFVWDHLPIRLPLCGRGL